MTSYRRRFVKGFSTIAGPMNQPIAAEECQVRLGHATPGVIQSSPDESLLAYPDLNADDILITDAWDFGLGGCAISAEGRR